MCAFRPIGLPIQSVVKLKTPEGEILVEVDQPGATVLIDEKQELIVTSAEKKVYRISAAAGERKLKVRLPSGESILSTDVQVEAGRETSLFRASLARSSSPTIGPASQNATPDKAAPDSKPQRGAKSLTVAQDGSGDCRTINEALGLIAAGGEVRILDDAEYREHVTLDSSLRHEGLTIESPKRATIVGTKPRANVIYVAAPRVTLRGLAVRSETQPAILCCIGFNSAGAILDGMEFEGTEGQLIQGVSLEQLKTVDPSDPVQVRNCRFQSCAAAIRVSGLNSNYKDPVPCAGACILNNVFVSNSVGLRCVGDLRDIVVAANQFVDCSTFAVQLEQLRGTPKNIWVLNNTMFANRFGFRVWDREVVEAEIHVLNNLTLASVALDWAAFDSGGSPDVPQGPLDSGQIHQRWQVLGNWREGSQPDEDSPTKSFWLPPGEHDRLEPQISQVSRISTDADFLRPAADSPLASAAHTAGRSDLPKFVGALPPNAERFDWQPLIKKLLTEAGQKE